MAQPEPASNGASSANRNLPPWFPFWGDAIAIAELGAAIPDTAREGRNGPIPFAFAGMSSSGFANFIVGGFLVILAAWIPLFLSGTFVSLPMIAVAIGLVLGAADFVKNPMSAYSTMAETIAEFSLLVEVLGAGLRIDRRFSFRGWGSVWRLLFIVMPLSIAAGAFAARELLGLSLGFAVLLGAITSPTDPVLAAGV